MQAATSDNIADFEIYKRVLNQRADPGQIAELVEAISSRLLAGLGKSFEELEYDFGFAVEKHSPDFDFSKGEQFVLTTLQSSGDHVAAVVGISQSSAFAISDLMLGADPNFVQDETSQILNGIQKSLIDQFVGVIEPIIRDVLNIKVPLQRRLSTASSVKKNFGDFVNLQMYLRCEDKTFPFSLLIAQRDMLKVKIRQKPRETVEPPAARVTPDKDVELNLTGVVEMTSLTLADIATLTVGEKVPLTGSGEGEVLLLANGRKLHKCRIGQNHASYALLIEESYQPMQSILDNK